MVGESVVGAAVVAGEEVAGEEVAGEEVAEEVVGEEETGAAAAADGVVVEEAATSVADRPKSVVEGESVGGGEFKNRTVVYRVSVTISVTVRT